MPIYEYICTECNNKFELMRPISQSGSDADCPKCKKKARRALSTFCCVSTNESGVSAPIAGAGGGCSTCGSTSCGICHS
jgi:putative FmdB family regulatory protein